MRAARTALAFTITLTACSTVPAAAPSNEPVARPPSRVLAVDVGAPTTPRDRFAELAVGSDYPGTLIRDDSLAHLRLVREELGFRYVRFHAIFHDVLGTYREDKGRPIYDCT